MDIKTSNRATLKSYFVKNAMPTAGNFAELIDGALNQKDDGVAKLPNEPLSVQAEGDDASMKKVVNFYRNFSDPKPAWTLTLNPRSNPSDPKTGKPGWSIGDADGNSRFSIDQASGNVGVGTAAPSHKFHVLADSAVGLFESSGTQAFLRFSTSEGLDSRVEIANRPGGRLALWTAGGGDAFNITKAGNVGIGLAEPLGKLEVVGAVAISNGTRAAIKDNMASGSLSVGSTAASYGGGRNWNANMAALLLETNAHTEIAVHESGKRVASLMYYEGSAANRITIGRDMGWGAISQVEVSGVLRARADFNASKDSDTKMTYGGTLVLKGNAPQIDFVDTDHNDWSIHVNSNKMYFIREPWNYQDLVLDGAGNVGIGTDVPNAKLDVRGDVKVSGLYAAVASERLVMVRGIVHPDGKVANGAGYTVKRVNTGLYDVSFLTSFSDPPSVVATQIYDFTPNGGGGNTRDNAVVVYIGPDRARIKTGDGDGGAANRWFAFIAMGPR